MFKIGDFSRLSKVTVKALRYYDELGLLKPAHVDRFTGYRYYSAAQLPRLNRILALKDLGFALEQMAVFLDQHVSPEQIRGMLNLRRSELQQHITEEQARLARVEARLRQIEQEDTMPAYDVVLKKVEPRCFEFVETTRYPTRMRSVREPGSYTHPQVNPTEGTCVRYGCCYAATIPYRTQPGVSRIASPFGEHQPHPHRRIIRRRRNHLPIGGPGHTIHIARVIIQRVAA